MPLPIQFQIVRWFKQFAISDDVVIGCDAGLGKYDWTRNTGSTAWLSLEVDIVLWHDIPPNDAIIFNSGKIRSEFIWDRDASLVEMSMVEAVADVEPDMP